MASTYVNNLRLEEIGTGEQSGTWGDTTNTNLILIGQAVAWGTRAIANASTDNITITDGALDADRCLGLKLTGGGQACTVTLLPNTSSKTWFMYNATAAALTFTCGSGANVIIPAGQTKVIATDGLGSGGVVHDLLTAVNLAGITQTAAVTTQGTLTVGVDDTGYDVKFFGATSGKSLLWDESADSLIVTGTTTLVGTTNLDAVDIDGNVQLDGTFTVGVDDTGKDVKFFGATSGKYTLWDESADTLYVSGDLATVTAGTSNVVIGVNAGNSIASGGNYNVCVGDEAGTTITLADHNTLVGFNSGALLLTGGENTLLGDAAGEALDVGIQNIAVGYLALTNDTKGSTSTAVGVAALASQNFTSATNSLNTAVGYEAGTTLTTGLRNVMAGHRAGVLATTPNDLIAIGFEAGGGATMTGNNNICIGTDSGHDLTSGAGNIFIGTEAGDKTDDGDGNVGIGLRALGANCADQNTAVGASALAACTGRDNTAVGFSAGTTNIGGLENTAVGVFALRFNATGNNSTAVGNQALHRSLANNNTAVGGLAAEQVTSGTQNTFIGAKAGENATTPDSSVFIGFNAGGDAIVTGNQNVLIGQDAGKNITSANTSVMIGFNNGDAMVNGGANTSVGSGNSFSSTGVDTEFIYGRNATGGGAATMTIGNGDTDATLAIDGSDTSWAAASDLRLKKNIVTSTAGLSFIKELRPIQYEWKNRGEVDSSITRYHEADSTEPCRGVGGTFHGFVAQEVKTAIDNHSSQFSDKHNIWRERVDGIQSVSPGNLVPMLVKAIQELEARIATLEG